MKKSKLLRNIFGFLFGLGLCAFGVVRKAKNNARFGQYIIGIAFHNPEKRLFINSVRWLKRNGFSFISTHQLIDILKNKADPPPGSVWITFDDGWRENISNVIPYIVQDNIPVTFFISTEPVENTGYFWWNLSKKHENSLHDHFKIQHNLLYTLAEEKRKEIIDKLAVMQHESIVREAMDVDEIRQISQLPQVTVGSHTSNHVITVNCTDSELSSELIDSKKAIEEWINDRVICFAYPNGEYNGREISILKESGIELAATTDKRFISKDDDPYLVPRFVARDDGFLSENICHMTGVWQPHITKIKQLVKGLKSHA